jgi:tight adherence protein C
MSQLAAVISFGICAGLIAYVYIGLAYRGRIKRRLGKRTASPEMPLRGSRHKGPVLLRRLNELLSLRLPVSFFAPVQRRLDYLGYADRISAPGFLLACLAVGLCVSLFLLWVVDLGVLGFAVSLFSFFLLALLWLVEKGRARDSALLRDLPHGLDILASCSRAGLSFDAALARLMEYLRAGPLRQEFTRLTLDFTMGRARSGALKMMAERIDLPSIRSFCLSVIQADRMGTAMAETLEGQAERTRQKEYQRLEKLAQQAPVRLLFPLIVFIFPVVFIVLFVPLGMQLMALLGGN